MLELPISPNYQRNYERSGNGDDPPCVVCGKGVSRPRWMLHIYWGTTAVTEAEAAELQAGDGGAGDLGGYPVGADCLRRHPELRPYAQRA